MMAHDTEQQAQHQQDKPSQSRVGPGSDPDRGTGKTGKVYEYQQGKEITGEQHSTGAEKARTQAPPNERQPSPADTAKP